MSYRIFLVETLLQWSGSGVTSHRWSPEALPYAFWAFPAGCVRYQPLSCSCNFAYPREVSHAGLSVSSAWPDLSRILQRCS